LQQALRAVDNPIIDAAVELGNTLGLPVVVGEGRPDREGAYFNPTILTDIASDMQTFDQELSSLGIMEFINMKLIHLGNAK